MKATRDALGDTLKVLAKSNKDILALDADLGGATKIRSFGDWHPERFFQIGIAEANMIGIASGLSEYGYKVFLASFGSFLTGRYDIIRCSLAYPNCPVVLVGTHVGMAIGKDGVTQMGLEDVSLMRALPNMKILNPASYSEAIKIVEYLCNTELDSPHYLRLGRQPVIDVEMPFEFGKGQVAKEGTDITLFSTGCILGDVLEAAQLIEHKSAYSVRVVNMPTLKPIDRDIIVNCAKETAHLFSIEDHSIVGGLGSAISEVLSDECPHKLVRIGLNDEFPESAQPADLYEKYGLSAKQIAKRVLCDTGYTVQNTDIYNQILDCLVVYDPVNEKVRYGRDMDGGYVVVSGYEYDCLLTVGLADDMSFEQDFVKNNKNMPSFAFDGTVRHSEDLPKQIKFIQKNVDAVPGENTVDLTEHARHYNDIFLKFDIEGEEWNWLPAFKEYLPRCKQITFEAHAIFPDGPPPGKHVYNGLYLKTQDGKRGFVTQEEWMNNILRSLRLLANTHYLVHAHQNADAPYIYHNGNPYPSFLELTYIRKDCEINGRNKEDIPVVGLDFPSGRTDPQMLYADGCRYDPLFMDQDMNFYPFKETHE